MVVSDFKFNSRKPYYNDDSDYTTNAPSYYDDLARKNQLIKYLAKKIWEYEKTLNESLENIEKVLNEYIDIVDGKLEIIDNVIGEGFNDVIEQLLREWVNDGTLNHIINEEIFNTKADVTYVDSLEEKINIRSQYYSDKPLVSFSFDDGRKEDWTRFKPIFDSEGIVGNICLITDQVGNSSSMTIEQVKELKNNGWSVASHLKTHPDLRNISLVQAEKELKESQEFLKKHGLDYDILV